MSHDLWPSLTMRLSHTRQQSSVNAFFSSAAIDVITSEFHIFCSFISWLMAARIGFSSTILLLLYFFFIVDAVHKNSYQNFLLRIDDESIYLEDRWDRSAPMKYRGPGQATLWDVEETFSLHLTPKEHCQEVWICDSGPIASDGKAKDETMCRNRLVIRPMEGSIEEKYEGRGRKRAFPFPYITLKKKNHNTYGYSYAAEDRDATGRVKVKEDGEMTIKGKPLIITSSPYCEIRLQVADGRKLSFKRIQDSQGVQGVKTLPIASFSSSSTKQYNEVMVATAVNDSEVYKKCPFWIPKHRPAPEFANFRWQQYLIDTTVEPCEEKKISEGKVTASLLLTMSNPEDCQGVRVCFDDEKESMCLDPQKSVELMPIYNLFIATDNDQARSLEVPAKWLKHVRFTLIPELQRMTMSYAFMDEMDGAVQQHMFFESRPLLTNTFYVSLASSSKCSARLVQDNYFGQERVPQCVKITDCNVLTPKKFAPMLGSYKLDGQAKEGNFPSKRDFV